MGKVEMAVAWRCGTGGRLVGGVSGGPLRRQVASLRSQ